jgi:hypothetical protein
LKSKQILKKVKKRMEKTVMGELEGEKRREV